jgi:hypothetical protein
LAAAADFARYLIVLSEVTDLSASTVTYRVFLHAGTGGQLRPYVQHNTSPYALGLGNPTSLSTLSGWTHVVFDVSALASTFDTATVGRVGVQVSGAGATSWTNPTVVYVDSIAVANAVPAINPYEFVNASAVFDMPSSGRAAGVLYLNSADNPTAGSALSWLGP